MRDGNKRRAARRKKKARTRAAPGGNGSTGGPPQRRQRLLVRRFDIGSIFRISIIFYLSLSCVILVAAMLLWLGATVTGVRSNMEEFIGDLFVAEDFRLVGTRMLALGAILGGVLVILGTAANLVMAILYNLISDVVGGLTVVVEGSRITAGPERPGQSGRHSLADSVDAGDGEVVAPRRPEVTPRRQSGQRS